MVCSAAAELWMCVLGAEKHECDEERLETCFVASIRGR
jgi:hypothetical protein